MENYENRKLIKNAIVINGGHSFQADVFIEGEKIKHIVPTSSGSDFHTSGYEIIHADGLYLFPGVIDDQVHFREPGLTYKAEIYTESKAAVAGGITSFMEMPNTIPNTLTQELLEEKYALGAQKSLANYSFYMGASNDNLDEVVKTNPENVCGIKIFMGSSTGNMLVDDEKTLEGIFAKAPVLVAVHCEDEETIRKNFIKYKEQTGTNVTAHLHPMIRSAEACFLSSSKAVRLAKKHGTRLHVLHLSTAREMELFDNQVPLKDKMITAEVCIHHLWFSDKDYEKKGNFIKWNPAIKREEDREALFNALLAGNLDVVATDHAPHSLEEKERPYFEAPAGGPMVQHALVSMLEMYHKGKISLTAIVEKMCHNPAIIFKVKKRGFIRDGYYADLVLVDLNDKWKVNKENILYKCGWSPMEEVEFSSKVKMTFVNGHLTYKDGVFDESKKGKRLLFNRK